MKECEVSWLFLAAAGIGTLLMVYWLHGQYFNWRHKVLDRVVDSLCARAPMERESAIGELIASSGVPLEFAAEFLGRISSSYGVEPGIILPSDRFDAQLSVPRESLPPRLARRVKEDRSDGGNLFDFITFEWRADHGTGGLLPGDKLADLAARARTMTVAQLCGELYRMEREGSP